MPTGEHRIKWAEDIQQGELAANGRGKAVGMVTDFVQDVRSQNCDGPTSDSAAATIVRQQGAQVWAWRCGSSSSANRNSAGPGIIQVGPAARSGHPVWLCRSNYTVAAARYWSLARSLGHQRSRWRPWHGPCECQVALLDGKLTPGRLREDL